MQRLIPSLPASWRSRAQELISRAERFIASRVSPPPPYAVWVEIEPIDVEGEDTTLTEGKIEVRR